MNDLRPVGMMQDGGGKQMTCPTLEVSVLLTHLVSADVRLVRCINHQFFITLKENILQSATCFHPHTPHAVRLVSPCGKDLSYLTRSVHNMLYLQNNKDQATI